MPIYEASCVNPDCVRHGAPTEYVARQAEPVPLCDACGRRMIYVPSPFAPIRTGYPGGRYADKRKEDADEQGHWAWRVRSSPSGKPEPVWIDSWSKQAQFCKEEGLLNPWEAPSGREV